MTVSLEQYLINCMENLAIIIRAQNLAIITRAQKREWIRKKRANKEFRDKENKQISEQ